MAAGVVVVVRRSSFVGRRSSRRNGSITRDVRQTQARVVARRQQQERSRWIVVVDTRINKCLKEGKKGVDKKVARRS